MKSTRTGRRLLVVGIYVGYVAIVGSFWAATHMQKYLLAMAVPAFALLGYSYWQVSQAVRSYSYEACGRATTRTDERQAQVRDRSFVAAYQILGAAFCLFAVAITLWQDFRWTERLTRDEIQAFLWFVVLLTSSLPSCVVAWTLPDEEQELHAEDLVVTQRS